MASASEVAAANAEPADFDQAGQFGEPARTTICPASCVEMDTVIADQHGLAESARRGRRG